MKTTIGVKTQKLENGEYLHFWYANNRNRGTDNVTVVRSTTAIRAPTAKQQTENLADTRTCGWRGHVNLSRAVLRYLGL